VALFQVLAPGDPAKSPPPARISRRIGSAALDLTLFVAIFFSLAILWGHREGNGWRARGLAGCCLLIFIPIYWFGTETWFGGTPGKLLLGLEVFSMEGSELEASQVVKRNLAKLLDSPFLYLFSALVALTNPLRQTAGDLWARTMVTESRTLRQWRYGSDGRNFDDWLGSFKKPPNQAGPVA
jgi:uncharacterized RDD family membrane protein YckC